MRIGKEHFLVGSCHMVQNMLYLWQRFTFAETSAFDSILDLFWNDRANNAGKLPVVEFTGSKIIQVGMGSSSELSFKFSKWADRFDG